MNITSINGNKLLLVDNNIIENNDLIINELLSKNLDTAILYKHIDTNKFNIYILEKDGSTSIMCGNGCIALGLKLKDKYNEIILINKLNEHILLKIVNNEIIFNLIINNKEDNLFIISGEPHKIYSFDIYNREEHIKLGELNIPDSNTTVIFKLNNKYYYSTYERGVNKITDACGTGSFASIYYINKIINEEINTINTINDTEYNFIKENENYFLIVNIN